MKDKTLFLQAKKDFAEMVKNSNKKQKESFLIGYGISSMVFAKRYADPHKNNPLYKKIYNIPYNWAENYKVNK